MNANRIILLVAALFVSSELSAAEINADGRFLFHEQNEATDEGQYLSLGRVRDGALVSTTRLLKLATKSASFPSGRCEWVTTFEGTEVWIQRDSDADLICFNPKSELITAVLRSKGLIGPVPGGLLVVREKKDPAVSEWAFLATERLDLRTHDFQPSPCPIRPGMWTWRAAVINPSGTLLAVETDSHESGFDVHVQGLAGTNTNSFRLNTFLRIPKTSGDPSIVSKNLLWTDDTHLIVASASGDSKNLYCLDLYDISRSNRVIRTIVPSTNKTVFSITLQLSPAQNGKIWFKCDEHYEFDRELKSATRVDDHTVRVESFRRDYGWSGQLGAGSFLTENEPGRFEIRKRPDAPRDADEVVARLDGNDGQYAYLLLGDFVNRRLKSVILDRRSKTLIQDVPMYPICWLK